MVKDVAEAAAQARAVERAGAREHALLADGKQQLDIHRHPLPAAAAGEHQQHGDGGLVVGAQDPLVGVFPEPIAQHRLHGSKQRHGVHVRAQQDAPPLIRGASQGGPGANPREQVAAIRARHRRGVILLHPDPQRPQLPFDQPRAGALVAGWTLGTAELGEDVV